MARQVNRLTARTVATIKTPGLHADGGGLYLQVEKSGSKSWSLVFFLDGKRKQMGLGPVSLVTLGEAREAAVAARKLVLEGTNPIDARRLAQGRRPSFGEVADELLASLEPGWRNAKHGNQWRRSLEVHAKAIRHLQVDEVTTEDVLGVLLPIWTTIPESAQRTQGRIERVFDAAKAKGHRAGENPARWRGHLKLLLPARQKLTRGHHPALPYDQLSDFFGKLRSRPATAARALEFTILTVSRTSEALGALPAEVDLKAKVWTVPAERMKAGVEHRVPLSPLALEIVQTQLAEREEAKRLKQPISPYLFPGPKAGQPLSNMAMDMLLRRMGYDEITVHGFRSTFSDWAHETTEFQEGIIEAALAHAVGTAVERAYRRGDALAKRRALMEAWATFATTLPADPEKPSEPPDEPTSVDPA